MWLLSLIPDFLYQIWFFTMLGFRNTKFTLKKLRVCLIMDLWSWRQAQRVLANTWSKGCCCCCSVAQSRPTLCDPMDCSTPGFLSFSISQSLLKLTSIESVMPPNHLILCYLLLLPSIFPSIRVFSMSGLFASGGQSIGASDSALPVNIQDWFPLRVVYSKGI